MTISIETDRAVTKGSRLLAVALIITVLAWASAFVVIRGVGEHFGGGELALGRLLIGTVLLGLLVIGRRWVRPTVREWVLIGIYGVAWFGGYNVALNIAEHTLDAGTTSMVVNIGPILIALGAGVFLGFLIFGEIPTILSIVGGVICLVGVALSRRRSAIREVPAVVKAEREAASVPEDPQNLSQ